MMISRKLPYIYHWKRYQKRRFPLIFCVRLSEIPEKFAFLEIRADDEIGGHADVEHQRVDAHGRTQPQEGQAEQV